MFRVGCWLLIGGAHLWLLLLLSKEPVSLWADSGHQASSLTLQFVTVTPSRSSSGLSNVQDNRSISSEANTLSSNILKDVVAVKKINKVKKANEMNNANIHKTTVANAVAKIPTKVLSGKESQLNNEWVKSHSKVEKKAGENSMQKNNLTMHHEVSFPPVISHQKESFSSKQQPPKIIYKPSLSAPPIAPRYPEVARRKKQEGIVWLDVFLDEKGQQRELMVYKSSGVSLLDRAAVYAVSQWQFSQYQQEYAADLIKIRIPIEFSLN